MGFLQQGTLDGTSINLQFLWFNLSQPDPVYLLPVLAGVSQLIFSFVMKTGLESHVNAPKNKKKHQQEEDKLEMAQTIQQQMLYTMPLMTTIIALRFPSGLALYWVVSTVFSLIQQILVSGYGGLIPILRKLGISTNS